MKAMLADDTDTPEIADPKQYGRSRVTNGSAILPGVDGRSVWARRFRDLMGLHLSDLGGDALCPKRSALSCAEWLRSRSS